VPAAPQRPSQATEADAPAVAPTPPQPVAKGDSVAAPVPASAPATQPRTTSAASRSHADRVHVVRPTESLWSIAADLLGDHASSARIAREVNRLWQLNSSRIATGDPDLLAIGTKLVLR